jgi:hypothetical protein
VFNLPQAENRYKPEEKPMSYLDNMMERYRTELSFRQLEAVQEELELRQQLDEQTIAYQSQMRQMDMMEIAADQRVEMQLQALLEYDQKHGTNLYGQAMAVDRQSHDAFAQGFGSVFGNGK